jgi:hypothetical protein
MASHVILSSLLLALSTPVIAVPIFGIGNTDSNSAVSTLSTAQTDPFVKPARCAQCVEPRHSIYGIDCF